jgi:hypothetical protein
MRVDVMTGVGPDGEREPVEFVLGARQVAVELIVDRWLGSGYRYFKLLGRDGALYILRYDETSGEWELTFFERTPRSALRLFRISTPWRAPSLGA